MRAVVRDGRLLQIGLGQQCKAAGPIQSKHSCRGRARTTIEIDQDGRGLRVLVRGGEGIEDAGTFVEPVRWRKGIRTIPS